MYRYEDIKEVHLEITEKCQAACPMCMRNENGGAINRHLSMSELSLKDCKKIFEPDFLKQLHHIYMIPMIDYLEPHHDQNQQLLKTFSDH